MIKEDTDILQDVNIDEHRIINSSESEKLKHNHVKRHHGLDTTTMKGLVPGKRGRG